MHPTLIGKLGTKFEVSRILMLEKIHNLLLGKVLLHDSFDAEHLLKQSINIGERNIWYMGTPFRPGLYSFSYRSHLFLMKKSRVGLFFPSNYRIKIGDPFELIGSPYRQLLGYFLILFFYTSFIVPLAWLLQKKPAEALLGLLVVALVNCAILFTLRFHLKLILAGFLKHFDQAGTAQ